MAEERFVSNLESVGVTVQEIDPDTGEQWRVSDFNGILGGSLDGIGVGFLEAPKSKHVIEMKTHGEKSFKALVKDGVEKSKPLHFAQCQLYMGYKKLKRAYYIAVNKNTDELYQERINYDKKEFEKLKIKAEQIITSERPLERIHKDPSWFECKWCSAHALCHMTATPDVNCRTCTHSVASIHKEDPQWFCDHYGCALSTDTQRKGDQCPEHRYIPYLLENWAKNPIREKDGDICYLNKLNEQVFYNGPYSSNEIHAAKDLKIIGNVTVDEIKDKLQGEIIK
jgi:hypothetical protein